MNPLEHTRRIESVVRGGPLASLVDAPIRASWRRCLTGAPLDPTRRQTPRLVGSAELRQRRERLRPLYDVARIEMQGLALLLNAPVGVMLTDHDGVIVGYAGDPRFAEMAYQSGLREGAVWSEAEQGTNGMGTCLATRDAVAIEGDQHFLYQNTALTCCGAPVRDGEGHLVGVLNLSGRIRLSTAPTLALVRLAVQNVENRVLLQRHAHDLILRFHPHREFIGAAGEGILAIDEVGRVKAANLSALEWLHLPDHGAAVGRSIRDVVGANAEDLYDWSTHPGKATRLPSRDAGSLCFGVVQRPLEALPVGRGSHRAPRLSDGSSLQWAARAPSPADQDSCDFCASHSELRNAEHQAIVDALDACGWNVSAAATALGISRRTLHRKIRQHDLRPHRGRRPTEA